MLIYEGLSYNKQKSDNNKKDLMKQVEQNVYRLNKLQTLTSVSPTVKLINSLET